jgi:hypothetical protein
MLTTVRASPTGQRLQNKYILNAVPANSPHGILFPHVDTHVVLKAAAFLNRSHVVLVPGLRVLWVLAPLHFVWSGWKEAHECELLSRGPQPRSTALQNKYMQEHIGHKLSDLTLFPHVDTHADS